MQAPAEPRQGRSFEENSSAASAAPRKEEASAPVLAGRRKNPANALASPPPLQRVDLDQRHALKTITTNVLQTCKTCVDKHIQAQGTWLFSI